MPKKFFRSSIAALILSALLSAVPVVQSAASTPGYLDPTFGTDGILTTSVGGVINYATSLAIDSNGKINVAGFAYIDGGYDFAVVRYNSNGSLDTSFGVDGKATTDFGASMDVTNAIAIDSNGKIILAGYSNIEGNYNFAVVRYNIDGTLDTSFSADGKLTTDIGADDDVARSIAIDGNDKIVLSGYSYIGGNYDFAAVRYNVDGTLDTSFSADGKLTTGIGASNDISTSIAIDENGKIVLAGYAVMSGGAVDFAVVRYNIDGTLDTSFSADGKVTTDIGDSDNARAVVIDGNGKIVVAGSSYLASNDFAVVRYNSNGSLDTSFSTDGILTVDIRATWDDAYSLAIESNGKIIVAGMSWNTANTDIALVRYNSDGLIDSTFGTDGIIITAIGTSSDQANSLAIDNDGKIVVAGVTRNVYDFFAVVRYIAIDSEAEAARVAAVAEAARVAAAAEAARVAAVAEAARVAAAAEAARVAAAAEAARVAAAASAAADAAKKQKELTELLSVIPSIAGLALDISDLTNSLLLKQKCVKGKTIKYVKKGARCPKGYVKKK
jgi:uncharacterized delta-60 repeat protein